MSNEEKLRDIYQKDEHYFANQRHEMLEFLPSTAKRILDVGCGEGNFASLVKQHNQAEVWGIELDVHASNLAKTKLHKVFCGTAEDCLKDLPENYFDVIYFNDVLEHLIDPYTLIKKIQSKLSSQGMVIASIPHVKYFRVLNQLLFQGEWKYEDTGVLDKTHLRFFTKKSMVRMFEEGGFKVDKIKPINKSKSFRPMYLHLLTLGLLGREISYPQFMLAAKRL
jgi:2-polyprenyl-3-methyl-5-hydroxy-6-metoxy-1,4-benzoquinol methylase